MKILRYSAIIALLASTSIWLVLGQAQVTAQPLGKLPNVYSAEANYMSLFGFRRYQYWLKHSIWVLPKGQEIRLRADSEADTIILLCQVVPANPKHHTFVVELGQTLDLRYSRIAERIYWDTTHLKATMEMGEMYVPRYTVNIEYMTEEQLAQQAKKLLEDRELFK